MLAGVLRGEDLAQHAAVAEAAGHHDAVGSRQHLFGIALLQSFGVDPADLHLGVVGRSGVAQGFLATLR